MSWLNKLITSIIGKVDDVKVNQTGNQSGGISTDGDLVGGRVVQSKSKGQVTIKHNGMTITGQNITIGGKKIVVNGKIIDPNYKDEG